jgi:hypothetical protein
MNEVHSLKLPSKVRNDNFGNRKFELSETDYFLLFSLPEREGVMVVFEQTNRESKNAPMTHDGRVQPLSMKLNAKM